MTTVQVRVDSAIKATVENILANMGLDMSTAIRMYLKKIQQTNSIPFAVSNTRYDENGFTTAEKKEILDSLRESKTDNTVQAIASLES